MVLIYDIVKSYLECELSWFGMCMIWNDLRMFVIFKLQILRTCHNIWETLSFNFQKLRVCQIKNPFIYLLNAVNITIIKVPYVKYIVMGKKLKNNIYSVNVS